MAFGKRFKAFTIHAVMCRVGYPMSKISHRIYEISQVTLVVADGGPDPLPSMASYAPELCDVL